MSGIFAVLIENCFHEITKKPKYLFRHFFGNTFSGILIWILQILKSGLDSVIDLSHKIIRCPFYVTEFPFIKMNVP